MEEDIPSVFTDRFSYPPPPSPLDDLLTQPDPPITLAQDLLEASNRITEKYIAHEQIRLWDAYQTFRQDLSRGIPEYVREHREIPRDQIIEMAHNLALKERQKMREAIQDIRKKAEQDRDQRNRNLRTFCKTTS